MKRMMKKKKNCIERVGCELLM
ncbi:hypothetical protein A2U01_0092490, partial [Trifolium medium]|nr:hypothetical protein [Trifolium medium]